MTKQVSKVGEEFAVTFTADELRDLGVRDGGLISVERAPARKITLDEILVGMTPENRHPATDWGPDVGAEVVDY